MMAFAGNENGNAIQQNAVIGWVEMHSYPKYEF
jgi:hypothetical protein